jgi:hypothetical protein
MILAEAYFWKNILGKILLDKCTHLYTCVQLQLVYDSYLDRVPEFSFSIEKDFWCRAVSGCNRGIVQGPPFYCYYSTIHLSHLHVHSFLLVPALIENLIIFVQILHAGSASQFLLPIPIYRVSWIGQKSMQARRGMRA